MHHPTKVTRNGCATSQRVRESKEYHKQIENSGQVELVELEVLIVRVIRGKNENPFVEQKVIGNKGEGKNG